ncbi:MAG: peptidylprolyl isomerase [Flavobacteriaceae bacterium]|nr:peptidylprolyl isomerase [Flavobacteriaceae bacterium]
MKRIKWAFLFAVIISFTACENQKIAKLENGIYANIKTNKGEILLKLTYKETPVTVANFISLTEGTNTFVTDSLLKGKPFYNGIKFHRVIKKFMIQTGDPNSLDTIPNNDGAGGPGYNFQDEFPKDSVGKLVRTFNRKGILAMANAGANTNGSQFFITHVPTPHLNGRHTIFGYVVDGQSVVDSIVKGDSIVKIDILKKGNAAKIFDANAVFSKSIEDFKKMKIAAAEKAKKITIKETEAFIADMKKQGYKIKTYDSGLVLATIKKGKGKKPVTGDIVSVHYNGRLTTGLEFDSSYKKGRPIKFPIGVGRVIRGWDFGIMQLNVGTKGTLFIPSSLAYGARGAGGVIPPNANLIFDVELLKIGK